MAVAVGFNARDGISAPMNNMARAANRFGKNTQASFNRAEKASSKFKSTLGAIAPIGGIAAIGTGVAAVTRQFVEFDDSATSAFAKFKDLDSINTQRGQEQLNQLKEAARKVGKDTQFNAVQAANGLDFLAMAGFNAKQAMALLPGVVDLATAGNLELDRATDIASDAIGAFGLATNDTAQLTKNFNRIQDVMAATVTATNTDVETLFETIKFGAAPFTAAGQSMETFNAIAGRMAANGIKGSQAGTALRSAVLRLQKPTGEVTKGLATFGLTVEDLAGPDGQLLDMVTIMGKLEKGGKGLTTVQRNAALSAITGKNAFSAWASVMNEGVHQTADLQKQLQNAEGSSAKMAATMRTSLGNQLKGLTSIATEFGFTLLNTFVAPMLPILIDGLKMLISLLITLKPVIMAVVFALVAYWTIQKLIIAVGWIKFLIQSRALILLALQGHLLTAKALLIERVARLVAIGAMVAQKIATIALTVANWAAAAATMAFGVAMQVLMSPITLIILIIVALAALVYLVIDNWDIIAQFFIDLWNTVVNAFIAAWEWLKSIFFAVLDWLKANWKDILLFFIALPMFLFIMAGRVIRNNWESIKGFFLGVWQAITGAFTRAVAFIKEKFFAFYNSIVGKLKEIGAFLGFGGGGSAEVNVNSGGGVEAPNSAQVAAGGSFQGTLDVNAPQGSSLRQERRGAQPIDVRMVGAN